MQIELLNREDINQFDDYLIGMDTVDKEDKSVYYLGAFEDEELCAVAAFSAQNSRIDLISICVADEDQSKKIGLTLIEEMTNLGFEMDSKLITATIDEEDVENGVGQFLWKAGFTPTRTVHFDEISIDEFLQNKMIQEFADRFSNDSRIVSADEVPSGKLNEFLKTHKFSFMQKAFNKKYSSVSIVNGTIESCSLISVEADKVSLEGLVFSSNKALSLGMLRRSISELSKDFPGNTPVSFVAVNDKAQKIADTIKPGNEATTLFIYEMDLTSLGDDEEYEQQVDLIDVSSESSFQAAPAFYALKNCSLICKDCRYCVKGNDVMECHRYGTKPVEVLNGQNCTKYSQIPMKEGR